MADAFVQVAPDSTGKKMQTFENTVSGNVVEAEAVTLVRSSDNSEVGTSSQPVRIDPTGTTVQPTNKVSVGSTTIQAAQTSSTDGTGANEVIRTIGKRFSSILTTANLGIGATFTSAWFDTMQTGDVWLELSVFSDKANAANGWRIEETDDTTDANFITNITSGPALGFGTGANVSANTLTTIFAAPRKRYWRTIYVNGGTATTTFKLTATASNSMQFGTLASGNAIIAGCPVFPIANLAGNINSDSQSAFFQAISAGTSEARMAVYPLIFNGSGSSGWDRPRTPITFKTATATASGNTAVWTPTSGKKFRLMRYQIELSENATLAVAALITVKFQDSTTDFGYQHDLYIPAAALTNTGNAYRSGWIDMGNGYLSTTANNVLNFNIGGGNALTGGQFRINVAGTEE